MANDKSGRNKKSQVNEKLKQKIITGLIVIVILSVIIIFKIYFEKEDTQNKETQQKAISQNEKLEGELILTMIDVGQGDSFLMQQNSITILIDCGKITSGKNVVKCLKNKGITKIDYLFVTHPHEDHIGGVYEVIANFEIGTIIIPKVQEGKVAMIWNGILMAIIKYGEYNLEYAKEGSTYNFGNAIIKIIGPISQLKCNINNYSTVLKVSFGEMDIIMTGDAEKEVEEEILQKYQDELDAEILKVGHHGSSTSTTDEFLEAVSPDYALISAKIGNKHEHPFKSVMQKLEEAEIEVYRTDENGTVEVVITPQDATFSCEPGDYLSGIELEEREEQKSREELNY